MLCFYHIPYTIHHTPYRLIAGCTAIVAFVVTPHATTPGTTPQRLIYVGNAGDSRAVLSRAGQALALSEDHKPALESEAKRIKDGGGFVNFAGRVNGNLNLSRSLG